jgi:hypothetical protein
MTAAPILARVAIDPADAERGLVRLVMTLVEFLRKIIEAQALRRFEAGALTGAEEERLGAALAATEDAVRSLCNRLQIAPEDLQLDLGPLGRLI